MNPTPITLLLVDDHAVMRMGLSSLLGTQPELRIVGEAGDGETAVQSALKLRPDVIVMDLMMPGLSGIEATRRLCSRWTEAKVLILTTFGTSDAIAHALDAGALGAVLKSAQLPVLLEAIRTVAEGRRFVSREIQQILIDDPPLPDLSERQRNVLDCVIRGLSNADIAKMLGISLPRVKEHLNIIFAKLGAANRAEAVAIAVSKHLLKI